MMYVLLMFVAGITVAIQPSVNARLAQKVGVIESACISFAVGTLVLLAAALVAGKGSFRSLDQAQWWEWLGGLLGAFFVSITIVAVPRIGTAAAMSATIAAQLLTGMVLDHYKLFGYGGPSLDLKRAVGALLLLSGALMVARR